MLLCQGCTGASGVRDLFPTVSKSWRDTYTQNTLGVGAPAARTHPSGTGGRQEQGRGGIAPSPRYQDERGLPTYLLGAPGTLGMDEETLFAGSGASAGAQVETFSKREQQSTGWAEQSLHSKTVLRAFLRYPLVLNIL